MPRYTVRFFFEWLGPWLWAGDEITRETWGYSDLETKLLSEVLQKRGNELRGWHDTSLNWGYPLDPGSWRQEECDQFNQAVRAFFGNYSGWFLWYKLIHRQYTNRQIKQNS